jgi:hypothetical protein
MVVKPGAKPQANVPTENKTMLVIIANFRP